jgi:two-component system, cell cycle sensor histidine kinase and response regulator CckA
VIGRTTIELGLYAHPDDVNRIYDGIRSERVGSREVIIRRKNGEEGNFLITGASTEVDSERCVIGAWHDITGLRRADAARQQSDERLRLIAEAAREVFWLADTVQKKILYVSPAYETIWGRTCASLYESPRDWVDAIHPEDRARVLEAEKTRQLAGTYDVEYRVLRPDGSVRWIRDRATPAWDANGKVVRMTGVAEDITDRRDLEDRLRQAQRLEAIGGLAGGVAHDFNNILSVILTYAEMLISDLQDNDPVCADLREIKSAGQRAADLTRQLLAFSRKQILQPRVIDLNEILAGMEKMLRRLIGEDVEFMVVPSSSPSRVNVDPGQMEQVIMNLAVNARDAMPGGGKLTIEVAPIEVDGVYAATHPNANPGPHVMLAVSDTGIGMDAATQARVFEPFFTTKEKGTGLGLAIVRQAAEAHGGKAEVEDTGHGALFRIRIPWRPA